MRRKILVVEDDKKTAEIIRLYLEKDRYHVLVAHDGRTALELARQRQPDLIVLDLMLPNVDGWEVCRRLCAEAHAVPIIMLTARSTEDDKLIGLDLGADDYVTKPFSPRELLARIRAVLRRAPAGPDEPVELRYGDLHIHRLSYEVRVAGARVHLTPREFKLLETLAREPGRVFTRLELVERAFGLGYEGLERTVDVHLMNLRRKIEPDPAQPIYVQTVYGVGYRLGKEPDDVA